jgi:hypothetical protein
MKRNPGEPSEADIERTCTQLLELDGWRALRTDPVSRCEWGKGFGEPGMPDHLYLRYLSGSRDQVLWVEFKKRGGKVEPRQKAWHEAERARGAVVWVAGEDFPASIEGFAQAYASSGLMRRKLVVK